MGPAGGRHGRDLGRDRGRGDELGAELRTSAPVARITTRAGRATGVVLESARRSRRASVVSSADVRTTLGQLLEPGTLSADDEAEIHAYKFRGSSGKVNFALDGLPTFRLPAARNTPTCTAEWSRSRLRSSISSGPTTTRSTADSPGRRTSTWDFPASSIRQSRHPASTSWPASSSTRRMSWPRGPGMISARRLATRSRPRSRKFAPDLPGLVVGRQILTPLDIERTLRADRGQHLPGRAAPRAAVQRPADARRGLRHARARPVAVRIVDASRWRHQRRAGAQRCRRSSARAARPGAPSRRGRRVRYDAIVIGAGHNGLVCARIPGSRRLAGPRARGA